MKADFAWWFLQQRLTGVQALLFAAISLGAALALPFPMIVWSASPDRLRAVHAATLALLVYGCAALWALVAPRMLRPRDESRPASDRDDDASLERVAVRG